jgi:hypothetical protein
MMLADMGAEIIKIETAVGRTRQFDRGPANGCNRRVPVVAARSREGLLSILLQSFIILRCERWFAFRTEALASP